MYCILLLLWLSLICLQSAAVALFACCRQHLVPVLLRDIMGPLQLWLDQIRCLLLTHFLGLWLHWTSVWSPCVVCSEALLVGGVSSQIRCLLPVQYWGCSQTCVLLSCPLLTESGTLAWYWSLLGLFEEWDLSGITFESLLPNRQAGWGESPGELRARSVVLANYIKCSCQSL